MTKDQVAKIRDYNLKDDGTGNPIASVFSYIFNNELAYISTRDFVITDDANELIHAIKSNIEDPVSQARFPYKIMTGFYGNIQYMEALYNMENFQKAVNDLFVTSGLITADKAKMIYDWANSIRNQTAVPKSPGPYFKNTIMPIASTPVVEVRDDGLHHASPIDMPTLEDKINDTIKPLIENSTTLNVINAYGNFYAIKTDDTSAFAEEFKTIIASIGNDLYMASLADIETYALYNPDKQDTVDSFVDNAKAIIPTEIGDRKTIVLYIEAYNVRTQYTFDIIVAEPITEEEWKGAVASSIGKAINYNTSETFYASITVDNTIEGTISGDINKNKLINMIKSMAEGTESITYTVEEA